MERDLILPDVLKNIIMKQIISSDKCDELTDNGKKCGERFIYSINEYLFSREKLKDVMINCTKFCLKHLSDLAINGDLNLGYEVKSENKGEHKGERKIIPITKEMIDIIGFKNGIRKITLRFKFGAPDKRFLTREEQKALKPGVVGFLRQIHFYFDEDVVDDVEDFKKTMKNKLIDKNNREYRVMFHRGLIPKSWRKFIHDCFKYEDLDYIELQVDGFTTDNRVNKMINGIMSLGNVYINDIKIESEINTYGDSDDEDDKFYVTGITRIKNK